jgi:hypothetical protein
MIYALASGLFLLAIAFVFIALGWYAQARRFQCARSREAALAMLAIGVLLLAGAVALVAGW